jgi:hypothetical protein
VPESGPRAVEPDTTRFTIIINGHRQGERRMWQEAPDTSRYEHDWVEGFARLEDER